MSERTFPEGSIEVADTRTMAMKITCACCGAAAFYPFQTGVIRKPPLAAAQYFRNKGWVVGSSARKDFCPIHASPAKRNRKEKVMADKVAPPVAEPPREMTREDRRIINDKLDEVYAKDAYKAPWTDGAVARDLGVPRDWVSQVREQFFGPAGSNPLFEDYLAARDKAELCFKTAGAAFEAVVSSFETYHKAFATAKTEMESVRVLGRRIEREIGK